MEKLVHSEACYSCVNLLKAKIMQFNDAGKFKMAVSLLNRRKEIESITDTAERVCRIAIWKMEVEDYWDRYEE